MILITKYSKELLEEVVMDSISMANVLLKLGLKYSGGNYSHIKKLIQDYGINYSHFSGQGWNRGNVSNKRTKPEDYLVENSSQNSHWIKNKLFQDNVKSRKCESCENTEWAGHPIPLELHHVDGDRSNNTLSNLQILCPNCHSLTDSFSRKKVAK